MHLVCQGAALLSLTQGSEDPWSPAELHPGGSSSASLGCQLPGMEQRSDLVIVTANTREMQGASEAQFYRVSKFRFLCVDIQTYPSGPCCHV